MFSKLAIVLISTTALVSAGKPANFNKVTGKCNVGELNCCQSVQDAKSKAAQEAAGTIDGLVGQITGSVGLQCNSISVLGVGTASNCNAQPVCCSGNNFNGVIVLACDPINIDL